MMHSASRRSRRPDLPNTDPREDGTLSGYQVYRVPITSLTLEALRPMDLGKKKASLSKNMFTLGLVAWMYDRSTDCGTRPY